MKTKILVILSNIFKALEHEWFVEFIDQKRFDLTFVMINGRDSEMDKFLRKQNIPVFHFSFKSKTDLLHVTMALYRLMSKNKFQVVHTHLFEANICGMIAAKLAGIPKRVVTRHHSDFHHTWYPHAVKYDRFVNYIATDIIAISGIVKEILIEWEKTAPSKVHLIHHGLNPVQFVKDESLLTRTGELRKKYNIPENAKIIGVISRFIEWKGIQFIVPAFKMLHEKFPHTHLVLANASGTYKTEIDILLKALPEGSFTLIQFENDGPALFNLFDYFVHVPVSRESEAFGQVYIEALFSRIPSVFTLSGIACDIAQNEQNCIVVPYKNSDAIFKGLTLLIENPLLSNNISENGFNSVRDSFDVKVKINKLENLYAAVKL